MKTVSLLYFVVAMTLPMLSSADEKIRNLILGEGGEVDFGKSVPGVIDLTDDQADRKSVV